MEKANKTKKELLQGLEATYQHLSQLEQAEEASRESEEEYERLFDILPIGITILNLKGVIIYCNSAVYNKSGYTEGEYTGKHFSKISSIRIKDIPKYIRLFNSIVRGKTPKPFEASYQRKDGTTGWTELNISLLKVGGKRRILVMQHDITERKKAEEALIESERKYKELAESITDVYFALDKNLRYTYWNRASKLLTGVTAENALGKYLYDIFPDAEETKRAEAVYRRVLRTKKPEQFINEFHILDKTHFFEISTYPAKNSLSVFVKDITERKQMERALQESEEKFSKAFHASPNIMAIITLKDRRIIEVNENYTHFTGFTREEVIGQKAAELNSWVNDDSHDRILRILKEEGRVRGEEVLFRRKSGEIHTSLLSIELINIGGEPYMLTESIDITRLKQTEEELKQAMVNLEQSSARLAVTNKELEAFSYSVSHDLRSPLRSIDGFSQALLEDYRDKLDEHGQEYLNRLRSASQKMGELIDGLLKLSRLTRSEMHQEKVDLSVLAEEIATRLQETQPERRAKFIIGSGLTANGDLQMLRVLLENLLGNAWKFTSKTPQAEIEFGISHNGDKKTFFVKDNGAGFDMTYANKLFMAFQRLHDTAEFPGTGIGLATVQRIINRHSGNIRAEGVVGKGATFYFTLE